MKKIVLVGKFNKNFSDLNKVLSQYFSIQLCSDNPELLAGMISMGRVDLIIVSANGFTADHRGIFEYLDKNCRYLPVLCIGKAQDFQTIEEFPGSGRMSRIVSPALVSDVVAKIKELLGIEAAKKEEAAKKQEEEAADKKTILLVDDAAVQLRSMESILKDKYNVMLAESGDDAIEAVKEVRPDLVFLDYDMPGRDGRATLELLRNEENGKDVPVVFVTGVRQKERIMPVLKMKPAGYLVKPVNRDELLQMAQDILGREAEKE